MFTSIGRCHSAEWCARLWPRLARRDGVWLGRWLPPIPAHETHQCRASLLQGREVCFTRSKYTSFYQLTSSFWQIMFSSSDCDLRQPVGTVILLSFLSTAWCCPSYTGNQLDLLVVMFRIFIPFCSLICFRTRRSSVVCTQQLRWSILECNSELRDQGKTLRKSRS